MTPARIPPPEDDVQLFLPLLLTIETVDVVDVQPEVDVPPEVEVPEEIPTPDALNLNQHLYLPHLTK